MNLLQLFNHWEQIHADTIDTVDKFNDSDLGFLPFKDSWSAGQIMLHIANAEEGWFRFVVKHEYDGWPPEYSLTETDTVEKVKALLDEVHDRTRAYLVSLDAGETEQQIIAPWGAPLALGWIIWHIIEHEIHHRGELSLILGMLGREGLDV